MNGDATLETHVFEVLEYQYTGYTIHHQVFEKILRDIYSDLLEKFEERTPLSLKMSVIGKSVPVIITSWCTMKMEFISAMNLLSVTVRWKENCRNKFR